MPVTRRSYDSFELHRSHGMPQSDALAKAAEQFGITLPPSYKKYPGVQLLVDIPQRHATKTRSPRRRSVA
jgi:hypothetical protein